MVIRNKYGYCTNMADRAIHVDIIAIREYLMTLARHSILLIMSYLLQNCRFQILHIINIINWIILYLTDRMQQVQINGRQSSRITITISIV